MCDGHAHDTSTEPGTAAAVADGQEYVVKGMTCNHCAASVTEEVEQVAGVSGITVDLDGGRIIVAGEGFSDEAIHAAVDEAGYEVVAS